MENYSFLTSIYKNTKIEEMKETVESMICQTCAPEQIVIVVDGVICKELQEYIRELKNNNVKLYTIVPLEKNVGLGIALCEGMKQCRNELIARMDTDDICVLNRCEKQLEMFDKNPSLSIVGSNIAEFIDNIGAVESVRVVPVTHNDICKYMKKRCPFNHMSVMFKKCEVEKAGGYQDWHFNEDSYLWVRMFLAGSQFANIDENLVFARINKNTFERRGGWQYYISERNLFKFMRKNKIIGWTRYFVSKYERLILQVFMPNKMRQWVFKTFARKS